MEMKAMPSAMDTLLDLRDTIVRELKYIERTQKRMDNDGMGEPFKELNKKKKAFLIWTYNMLPYEVAEGIVKQKGEEEWHEN